MSSVNKATIIGNLGADPEVRATQNGNKIASFNVATSERWTDKDTGEKKERTQWHRIVIFNEPLVKVAEQYLRKGSKVYVEGQMETRKWEDQAGTERYVTEVVLRPYRGEITMLDSQRTGGVPPAGDDSDYGQMRTREPAAAGDRGGADDDIPF